MLHYELEDNKDKAMFLPSLFDSFKRHFSLIKEQRRVKFVQFFPPEQTSTATNQTNSNPSKETERYSGEKDGAPSAAHKSTPAVGTGISPAKQIVSL